MSAGPATGNQRLEAFRIVVASIADGTRCPQSTKELQLVSLELCRECRRSGTLHPRISRDAPSWLLLSTGDAFVSSPSPQKPGATRVPPIQARTATWNRPSSAELGRPICSLAGVELLVLGYSFNHRLDGVVWPCGLKRLKFDRHSRFEQSHRSSQLADVVDGDHPRVQFQRDRKCRVVAEIVGNAHVRRVLQPAHRRGGVAGLLQQITFGCRFN